MDKPDNNLNNSNKNKAGNNANKAGNNANKAGNNANKTNNNANKTGNNANKAGNNANKTGNNAKKAGNNANKSSNNNNKETNEFLKLIGEANNKTRNNINLDLSSDELRELNKTTSNAINRNNNTIIEDIKEKTKDIGLKTKELAQKAKEETKKIASKIDNKVRKVVKKDKNENDNENDNDNDNENKPKTKRQIRKERREMKRELKEKRREELGEPTYNINKIIAIIFITITLIALLYLFLYYYKNYLNDDIGGVMLINKPKDARRPIVISQDPKSSSNHSLINKSYNKKGGAQFSYSFWMTINDLTHNNGKMKHIFHKGNKSGKPNQNPGVWLHPNKNTIRIKLNVLKPNIGKTNLTSADIYEYIDIENIPLRKYVNITFVFVEQKKSLKDGKLFINCFDVYVNGLLKVRKELSSVPVFNDNDLWVNLQGGFDGVIAQLQYFNYYLKQEDIQKIMKRCPKTANCGIKADCPRYLDNDWWFS
jgi:hypothetical protein